MLNFLRVNFLFFKICSVNKCVNFHNIITNADYEYTLPTVEHFKSLSARNKSLVYSVELPNKCLVENIKISPMGD